MLKIKTKKIFIYIAVILLLIFLHYIKVLLPLENMIISLFNPVVGKVYSVSSNIRVTYNKQTDKRDLLKVIDTLKEQKNQSIYKSARLKILEKENEVLRQYLKFLNEGDYKYVLANIISKSIFINLEKSESVNEKNIIIDKGLKDGLEPGLGVVNDKGIIIGKVVEVKENISMISFTINSNCKLAATVLNQDDTTGITEGELRLTIKMNFIPQTEKINTGDIVITSGLEKNIPRGLVIGKVIDVLNNNNEVWQSAIIESLVDLDNLVIVSVLLPK